MILNIGRLLLLLSTVAILAACSAAPSWLEGSWQFDRDRTEKEFAKPAPASASGPTGMFAGLADMMGGLLIPQLSGMQVVITGKDRMTLINGQGKSESYQVVEKSPNHCTLKLKDGTVETYYRDGDEIYLYGTGSAQFKIYLRRQP